MEIDDSGNYPSKSDHNWIFVTQTIILDLKKNKPNKKTPTWIWNIKEEQGWDDYNNDLINNIEEIDKTTTGTFSDSLIDIITKSMHKNIGKIKIGKHMQKNYPTVLLMN